MKNHSKKDCLQIVPIFESMDNKPLELISHLMHTRQFKKGETLYRAEEANDSLFVVYRGQIKIYRLTDSGKEQLVRILNPGDFAGEWTIFNADKLHDDYAEAMRDTTVCVLNHSDLVDLLGQYPQISMAMMKEMSQRLDASERQTTQLANSQIEDRLAMFLADQVEGQANEDVLINLPMARKDLASYLGTTPESISRKFKELETKGLISQIKSSQILIHDVDQLILSD